MGLVRFQSSPPTITPVIRLPHVTLKADAGKGGVEAAREICSHSIKAVHGFGKAETEERYLLGAPKIWKCGRVDDCTGLENRRSARVREFESHRFRQIV